MICYCSINAFIMISLSANPYIKASGLYRAFIAAVLC